jgi:alpha-beta hydrolase superfamily lysophospholipase
MRVPIGDGNRTRRRFLFLLSGVLAFSAVALGPKLETDIEIRPPQLPGDLERYLQMRESRFDDLKPGTEKRIVWQHQDRRRTGIAIVYLHGFSATRQELAPLPERLARQLSANLFATRFAGHGRSGDAMAEGNLQAWVDDTLEAVEIGRSVGDRLLLLGSSTGGTLAAWLAANGLLDDDDALVLISPNFGPRRWDSAALALPWARHLVPWVIGNEYAWTPSNADHGRFWSSRYPVEALFEMAAAVKLASASDPGRIKLPTLVLAASDDRVVSTRKITDFWQRLDRSKRGIHWFDEVQDPDQHVLAGDILSPLNTPNVERRILQFLRDMQWLPAAGRGPGPEPGENPPGGDTAG